MIRSPALIALIDLLLLAVLLVVTDLSFRRGTRDARGETRALDTPASVAQSSTLGLFGLLLGFGLAMADARFSARRHLIRDEANAIGTTWLRAGFLPPDAARDVRDALARYTASRVEFYNAAADPDRVAAAEARASALQRQIWARTEPIARATPASVMVSLFVASLNDVIDRSADRRAALDDHVPFSFLLVVMLVAFVAAGVTGYAAGLAGGIQTLPKRVFPVLLFVGIATLIDLDQPRTGLIRSGQGSMIRLRDELRTAAPPAP